MEKKLIASQNLPHFLYFSVFGKKNGKNKQLHVALTLLWLRGKKGERRRKDNILGARGDVQFPPYAQKENSNNKYLFFVGNALLPDARAFKCIRRGPGCPAVAKVEGGEGESR